MLSWKKMLVQFKSVLYPTEFTQHDKTLEHNFCVKCILKHFPKGKEGNSWIVSNSNNVKPSNIFLF